MTKSNFYPIDMEQEIAHREQNKDQMHVLAVDDDRIMRMVTQEYIEALGHSVEVAVNGKEAMDMMNRDKAAFDIIVLDREMPEMNGLEVVARMKTDPQLRKIPIIMATGSDRPQDIKKGIDAGVFYYLTKPINEEVLKSVFISAVREVQTQKILKSELKKHKTSFNLIHSAIFELHTITEAEDLSAFLANCFPDPERVITGLAELIINAVEHGNLEISYEEKSDLIERGVWREEIDRRAQLPEHRKKKVEVTFRRNEDGLYVKIGDEGKGFDWQRYLEIDPSRATHNHGRGIAQANAVSFDELKYNTAGNTVTAIVREEEELEW
ncbi:MAG: response regulator [Alphaproteobacteria bacterium]|nr:response regulator [Alphaproteobacteria bacterium]